MAHFWTIFFAIHRFFSDKLIWAKSLVMYKKMFYAGLKSRVTRTFSQHWIIVGEVLRILLLDFDAKFTLLIPNTEHGKGFEIKKVRTLSRKNNKFLLFDAEH